MPDSGFHFAHPAWLLALVVPLLVWLWLRLTSALRDLSRYQTYADEHLLPYLLGMRSASPRQLQRRFLVWTLLWTLLVLAAAGPRWDYFDVQLFRPGVDLVILLDLSRSMDATDVSPNRLGRARQEIEDLVRQNRGARIGLIGFATVAHVIAPLSEDGANLQRQLPALSTDLVQLKGSRVTEALIRAQQMLAGQPRDSSRHLLLITDGDFPDENHLGAARELAASGVRLHVLGVGTTAGAPVPGPGNDPLRHPRHGVVISGLSESELKALSEAGNGIYREADYDDGDTDAILEVLAERGGAEALADERTRIWKERYPWVAALAMALLLPRFRRQRVAAELGQ